MKVVLPALVRPLLDGQLPGDLEITWVTTPAEAIAAMAGAEIAWVDLPPHGLTHEAVAAAPATLRWLFTAAAGLDTIDLAALRASGATVTNGSGVNAAAVADYAVMGVLVAAKRFDAVVRAFDRHEWLHAAPARIELEGTAALIVGHGAIGRMVGERLAAFGVAVTGATRSGRDGTLGADAWRERLGEYDWVILAAPATDGTRAMIGAGELAAMRRSAWIVNVARGALIDDAALVAALCEGRIGGAFLDPTHPEPLPADHPLWSAPNCLISMHLSGRSQTGMFARAAALFLDNLAAFRAGGAMRNVVDLAAGY